MHSSQLRGMERHARYTFVDVATLPLGFVGAGGAALRVIESCVKHGKGGMDSTYIYIYIFFGNFGGREGRNGEKL